MASEKTTVFGALFGGVETPSEPPLAPLPPSETKRERFSLPFSSPTTHSAYSAGVGRV